MHLESTCVENRRSEQEKFEDLATMIENTLKALDWGNLLILMVVETGLLHDRRGVNLGFIRRHQNVLFIGSCRAFCNTVLVTLP